MMRWLLFLLTIAFSMMVALLGQGLRWAHPKAEGLNQAETLVLMRFFVARRLKVSLHVSSQNLKA